MNSVLLMSLTAAGVAALFVALAIYVWLIARTLESIGGSARDHMDQAPSFLDRIAYGVRAIETETGHLPPNVAQLNGGLSAARDGLVAIRDRMGAILDVVGKQGGR